MTAARFPDVDASIERVRDFRAGVWPWCVEDTEDDFALDPIYGFDLHPIAYLEARARAQASTLLPLDRIRACLLEVGRDEVRVGYSPEYGIYTELGTETPDDETTARDVWRALFLADVTENCWPCFLAGHRHEDPPCGHDPEWA